MKTTSQYLQSALEIERAITLMQNAWAYLPTMVRCKLLRKLVLHSESLEHLCQLFERAGITARAENHINWLALDEDNEVLKVIREVVTTNGGLVSKTGALVMLDSSLWSRDDGA